MAVPSTDRAAVLEILFMLQDEGYELIAVVDGDNRIPTKTPYEALREILAVDESWLFVGKGNKYRSIQFVLGNHPYEVASRLDVSLSQTRITYRQLGRSIVS